MILPADDVGQQLVLEIFLSAYSVQMPTLMPATGRIKGTPASIRPGCRRKRSPSRWNRWIP